MVFSAKYNDLNAVVFFFRWLSVENKGNPYFIEKIVIESPMPTIGFVKGAMVGQLNLLKHTVVRFGFLGKARSHI